MRNAQWIAFYRVIAFPLLWVVFFISKFFNKKIKKGFEIRQKVNGVYPWLNFPKHSQPVWLHCSSGEFEYIKPVIKHLKEVMPEQQILVTYFSPTYADSIKNFKGVDMACPLPWDTWHNIRDFLLHHRPRCLLISRTDLWPEMLHQCYTKGILTLLFSATLSSNSIKIRNKFFKKIFHWVYSYISAVYCVSEKDKENFSLIVDPLNLKVTGDTRFDQVQERIKNPKNVRRELNPYFKQASFIERIGFKTEKHPERIFVAGSTWDEDEAIILPALCPLKRSVRLILAPHEPTAEHLEQIKYRLHALDWSYVLYSETDAWPAESVLIIDQMGILADLYSWGQMAFVGGSFKKTVHSVMEPLASGCMTFVGPFHLNNREAMEFKTLAFEPGQPNYVEEFQTAEQLKRMVSEAENFDYTQFQAELKKEMLKRTGASNTVSEWVQGKIKTGLHDC